MSPERRSAPRITEPVPLAIRQDGTALEALTNNLSATGVYCTMKRFIPPMTKVQVQFELPRGWRRVRIRCTGVVVRVEPIIDTVEQGSYHIAIYFTEISERSRASISRYVRERLDAASLTS